MDARHFTVVLLFALMPALAGLACTSTGHASGSEVATEACFDASRARSFSPLDDRFVYVRVGSDEHYLLTLDSVYTSLPFATGIAISGTFSRVCSDSGAAITFLDSGRTVVARIVRVETVASKEAAQKRVEEHRGSKRRD